MGAHFTFSIGFCGEQLAADNIAMTRMGCDFSGYGARFAGMAPRGCSEPGCPRDHFGRGLCNTHWKQAWRHHRLDEHPCVGHLPDDTPLADRLVARGWDVVGDCWELHGVPNANGYLYVGFRGRRLTAGRAAYEAWREPVHANQEIHLLCHNGACINPMHLVLRRITRRTCSVRGCSRPHYGRTVCASHYHKALRAGRLDDYPRLKVSPTATHVAAAGAHRLGHHLGGVLGLAGHQKLGWPRPDGVRRGETG